MVHHSGLHLLHVEAAVLVPVVVCPQGDVVVVCPQRDVQQFTGGHIDGVALPGQAAGACLSTGQPQAVLC